MTQEKTKVHTAYKNKAGVRVPSVTTILGVLDKPALVHWAWKLGIEGVDYKAVRDNAADIGTLAHNMIQCYLTGEEVGTSEYSAQDIEKARESFNKYLEWEKEHPTWKPVCVEQRFVSEPHQYGGTIDCLMEDEKGNLHLVDHKTSKAIYPEMFIQLAAYANLLDEVYDETGRSITDVRILRIGKEGGIDFEEKVATDLKPHWELFKHCRAIYELKKEI